MDNAGRFLQMMKNRWKLNLYMLSKLPSAFFSGVRVRKLERDYAEVTVPYFWFSRNPFRSTYFACLSMGAEMSSGILSLMYINGIKPEISMLVTDLKCQFHKKAIGTTLFTCYDGKLIQEAVQRAINTQEPVTVQTNAKGINKEGMVVADYQITWSFRQKKK